MHIEETGSPELGGGRSDEAALKGRTVRIHIDREPYETKTPTSGAALYALAGIGPNFELFREAAGDAEDDFIARNDAPVHLTEDEHFYSQKDYRIVVNAREVLVELRRLSYDQVVALASTRCRWDPTSSSPSPTARGRARTRKARSRPANRSSSRMG